MPKFCPRCESEYQDGVYRCPKDNIDLVKQPDNATKDYFIDIYAALDEIEAERIKSFLVHEGMEVRKAQVGIAQMPGASDNRFIISVLKSKAEKARDLLEQARADQVISPMGSFI